MRAGTPLVGIGTLLVGTVALVSSAAGPAGAVSASTEAQLQTAFANAAETTIVLSNSIDLTCGGGGDLDRASATPLTITGNGFTIRQTCANERVMEQTLSGALTLDGVTVTGGTGVAQGAGVFAGGNVTLTNSTVTANTATTEGGGISTPGGDVTATNSTISNNTTTGTFGNGGGGVFASGAVTLSNSTLSGNSANTGGGARGVASVNLTNSTVNLNTATHFAGGGVASNGSVTVINSTVTANTAIADVGNGLGGGIAATDVTLVYATVVQNTGVIAANVAAAGGTLTSFGSVVALPTGAVNCFQSATTSNGDNFSDDTSCGFTNLAQRDRENAGDPLLAALANNGGPTQTRLPQTGSPLLDTIPAGSCQADGATGITTDQRALPRPAFSGCDVGSVEIQPAAAAITVRFTG